MGESGCTTAVVVRGRTERAEGGEGRGLRGVHSGSGEVVKVEEYRRGGEANAECMTTEERGGRRMSARRRWMGDC